MARLVMHQISEDRYESEEGWVMQREYGKSPNGNDYNGVWVLRDDKGNYLDHNRYRYDIEARHQLDIRPPTDQWKTEGFDGFAGTSNIP